MEVAWRDKEGLEGSHDEKKDKLLVQSWELVAVHIVESVSLACIVNQLLSRRSENGNVLLSINS